MSSSDCVEVEADVEPPVLRLHQRTLEPFYLSAYLFDDPVLQVGIKSRLLQSIAFTRGLGKKFLLTTLSDVSAASWDTEQPGNASIRAGLVHETTHGVLSMHPRRRRSRARAFSRTTPSWNGRSSTPCPGLSAASFLSFRCRSALMNPTRARRRSTRPWCETPQRQSREYPGEGNTRFFEFGLALRNAGLGFTEIETTLRSEARYGRSPNERAAQVPSILASLRQRRRRWG